MSPLKIGLLLAAVLAGPPLFALVQTGELDSTGALVRGLIVAGVCTAGVSYIMKLANGYSEDQRRRQMIEQLTAAIEEAHAKTDPPAGGAPGVPPQPGSPTDTASRNP